MLAGDPVAHSLSPRMHEAALDSAGFTGSYEAIRCGQNGFSALVGEVRSGSIQGMNVTMPHKGLAHDSCDRLTEHAAHSASVNTMKSEGGVLVGHSTDVVAFEKILSGLDLDRPVVVLGSGGSARAALTALVTLDGPPTLVWARSRDRVRELQDRFGDDVKPLTSEPRAAIVINCTPLGMHGEGLPDGIAESPAALIDLPYGAEETPAVSASKAAGIAVVDGLEFLAMQAAASFTWWTGVDVEIDTMVRAARNA